MALRPPGSVDTSDAASLSFAAPSPGRDRARPALSPVGPVDPVTTHDLVHHLLPTETGRAMNRFPIQMAKVQRPPLPEGILRRERLLDWLDTKVHSRVVLVTAEAGYGKTTTLADWSRRTRVRTLWYRLDQDDSNWVGFVNYLVAAGREVDAEFAPITGALLREMGAGGATRDTIVDSFLRELPMLVATAPLAMVFDDVHLVDGSSDVRLFFRDLLARVPERLTVIILSRRTPHLSLARLRCRGEVSELRTDDLRFDVAETEQLFRQAYHLPLEPDVLAELSRRTEGWAASLQLVHAAIRGRTTAETRAFVRSLSSAEGALYDYLAEEVVGDLAPELQQLLMRTSILQQVDVELAALVAEIDETAAHRLMDTAETLGLLSGRAQTGDMVRYHPLVRDFLEARLRRDEGDEQATALHVRVARHADGRDWRLAAYHYCAISEYARLETVLAQATAKILGGGDFALAESYVLQLPIAVRRVEFDILASRMELHRGQLTAALELARSAAAEAATTRPADDEVTALTLFNLATLEFLAGNVDRAVILARDVEGSGAGNEIKDVARAFISINEATLDRNLDGCAEELTVLAARHQELEMERFFAITSLNLANVHKARGSATETLPVADQAIDALIRSGSVLELPSAHCVRAWALAFMGRWPEAETALQAALDSATDLTRAEALREAADVHLLFGSANRALGLLREVIGDGGNSLLTSAASPEQELLLVCARSVCRY
ncbi:MAG: hypothetical protein FJ037_10850, partial [Chloroflexi bacterium]|nr:hypothetical protein [Chloroflexota bacterium]